MSEKQKEKAMATRFPIQAAADFSAVQIPEPPQVIHGVLRAGQVGMLAASSKAGKSWALLDLCMAASIGADWLGWKTTAGRVLYINAELQIYDLQKRIEQLTLSKEIDPVPERLDLWHQRGMSRTISALIPEILSRATSAGPYSLIVPDPLYCFGGGRDENDNAEQAKTMGELSELAERSGAAVWIAHHFSKGNKRDTDHLDRASGAGMYARAVDTFMTMTRHEEDGCYSVETTTRSFEKPDPFVVRWEYPLWTVAKDLRPEELKKPNQNGRKAKYSADDLAALVPLSGMKHGLLYETYRIQSGISERHFQNVLRKCLDSGRLVLLGDVYRPMDRF